ncbi:MAG: hypothetical protein KKD77_21155, partial [Gammaproteobacteria bacterium]|nr:hypothetical protein [Gammaproteobacteria bacterium]
WNKITSWHIEEMSTCKSTPVPPKRLLFLSLLFPLGLILWIMLVMQGCVTSSYTCVDRSIAEAQRVESNGGTSRILYGYKGENGIWVKGNFLKWKAGYHVQAQEKVNGEWQFVSYNPDFWFIDKVMTWQEVENKWRETRSLPEREYPGKRNL